MNPSTTLELDPARQAYLADLQAAHDRLTAVATEFELIAATVRRQFTGDVGRAVANRLDDDARQARREARKKRERYDDSLRAATLAAERTVRSPVGRPPQTSPTALDDRETANAGPISGD